MSFPSGHREVFIMTGCPNQLGVCRAARFCESNLFCLFQFVKLSLDMDQNHAMRYYEICIVEIERTKNLLRNIFCYLKALNAFRGFPWTIFPFPSLVWIVVLLFEQLMPTYRTISVYSIAFMYICKKLLFWTDWKLLVLHFRWQWYLTKRDSRI